MRTWMWAVAILTSVVLGVAVSVIVTDARDPTRRGDTPDDHAWHCVENEFELGFCSRSARRCTEIQAAFPGQGACAPQPVANCFTIRKADGEVRSQCFRTAVGCDRVRAKSSDRQGFAVLDGCAPLDAAAHDRQRLYAQIAVVPCSLVLVGLAVGAVWRGRRRRRAG